MSANKKSPLRKRVNIKAFLDPTFSVPVKGTRQRMSSYEIVLRKQVNEALKTKDPKAIQDLINLFTEHKVLKPERGWQIPSVFRVPWYWDIEEVRNTIKKVKESGEVPRGLKPKFIEPLTAAGRKDMEEKEAIRLKRVDNKRKTPSVGYKRPPVERQFKKGVSGNPKGRPASGNDRRAVVTRVGTEKLRITENGRIQELETAEAMLALLRSVALQGRGSKYYANIVKKLLPEDPDTVRSVFILPNSPPPEEFEARLAQYSIKQQEEVDAQREKAERETRVNRQNR